ncbi:MAG: hypothetical protein ACHQIL_02055 [Steroidobacterales bacterium]
MKYWAAAIAVAAVAAAALTAVASVAIDAASVLVRQRSEYQAESAKTIVELQAFRRTMASPIEDARGRSGSATLINLNPGVNAWFLLSLAWYGSDETEVYHLENARPGTQTVALDELTGDLVIHSAGKTVDCALWSAQGPGSLRQARESRLPYAPLCADRMYLRNVVAGTFTPIERVTEFLRDHVWGGDAIVTFVRKHVFQDSFARMGLTGEPAPEPAVSVQMPRAAQVREADHAIAIDPEDLGIDANGSPGSFLLGRWYAVSASPGIYLSVMRPGAVSEELVASYPARVNPLDDIESRALAYLVAMDLTQYELRFALGTDHPRVGWSERALDTVRNPNLPGPDGIGSVAPLVVNGMVSPALIGRTVATFAGGFKREHGAFRYGSMAQQNHGSHYGFIEQGVVFSKLQPGLATLYVGTDGHVEMKTWARDDDALLDRIADARQNGIPLIEFDAGSGVSSPGPLVNQWGAGNWSGSVDERLRTVRGGTCLQQTPTRRFLIFGYFSTATPSAMARVFQAFGCRYAMQLDINALEHTYFALYTHDQGRLIVQHLAQGMAEVDRKGGNQLAPRFLGFPDDRDFFYVLRREGPP